MIKDDFYLTLPSHSSLQEFPQNANNNFKVRLPKLIRLDEGDWKVALASISMPNPKNAFPSWLTDDVVLFTVTSYYSQENNTSNKIGFETDMKLPHIGRHMDLTSMTLHDCLRGLVAHMEKIVIESRLFPGWMIGSPSDAKVFYPEFIVQDKEIVLDTSKIQMSDIGNDGLYYPAIWINRKLAYELGWFEDDSEESDPQFAVKLGPNLCVKINGHEIPSTNDIQSRYTASGHAEIVTHSNRYWIVPRRADGSLMNYIRLSLSVSWRFINLDYAFSNVFDHSTRSLYVYSDVGGSSVLGDQITDFIREVNYKREGKGSFYFEPTHLHYIPLRKETLDILQVQVGEETGQLVNFGRGITTVTFHFKNERRLLSDPAKQQ